MLPQTPRLSRRLLVKSTAALAAAALLPLPLLQSTASAARGAGTQPLSVGLILPRTAYFPTLERELNEGLSRSLQNTSRPFQINALTYNGTVGDATLAAQQLITSGAHLIVATIGSKAPDTLSAICDEHQRPLIIMNTGEDVARDVARHPFTFHSTLNTWQASYALGQWAAQKVGARAVSAASFYDSGYDAAYAFEAGYLQAGGVMLASHISHRPTDTDGFSGLLAAVQTHQPDFLYANYSGDLATRFLSEAHQSIPIPVLGSPFLTEANPANGIYSAGAWAPTLTNSSPAATVQTVAGTTGAAPSSLTMLGWDTGTLILTAIQNAGATDGLALQAALRSAAFTSPRGTLRMDAATQSLTGPIFLRWSDGAAQNLVSELPMPTQFAIVRDSIGGTGWITPYLT